MAKVSIRLLGGFEVAVEDRSITDFESGSARALLARLAAEPGRPLSRAMLAELLWPDRPPGAAAGNLRHTLSAVRRAIDDVDPERPVLVATRSDITLDGGTDVRVDVDDFRRLTAVAPSEPGAVASWEAAMVLRRGPFLADFDVPLSEAWDTWLVTMRANVDAATITTLRRLSELRERTGELDVALDHVRTWLELDPWNESAHRMRMRLLALDDRRGAALAHADELAATLHAELGIDPSPDTQTVIEDIRTGRFPVVAPDVPDLPPRTSIEAVREPCVGRTAELRWLRDHLDDALGGAGRLVVVVGQPGSGKSVLLRTFEREAVDAIPNLVVARGSCADHRGAAGDPFLAVRQILAQLLGDVEHDWRRGLLTPNEAAHRWQGMPSAVEAVLDHGSSLLGTIVDADALCARFERGFAEHPLAARLRAATGEARRRAGDPTRQRQPMVEQCARVLAEMAATRPVVMTIDDMQWADTGTLDVVAQLDAVRAGVPLMLVAALRPGEFDRIGIDPVRRTVNELASRARIDCRLEIFGSRAFVDAWLDSEPNVLDEAFRDGLYRTTDGNALFTVEVVRALKDGGRLRQDEHGRWCARETDGWDAVPPRVEATIAARLAALPEELRRDLDVACLQGQQFTAELVARVRGVPTFDVVLRLGDLCASPSSLLRSGGAEMVGGVRLDRFHFRHALFQQHLLDRLTPAVRRELHAATAHGLEQVYAGRTDRVAADLAMHFDAAGLAEQAVDYHGVAGRSSSQLSAYDEAVHHFERALELLATLEPTPELDRRELALLTALGACHQWHGYNTPTTTAVYDRLRELTRRVVPSIESASAIGALITVDGLTANYLDALAEAEQLLDLAAELESPPIDAVARMHLGWMLLMVGRIVEADEQLSMALDRYDPAWDDSLTPIVGLHVPSVALAWRSITAWHLGQFEAAREAGDRSIELARAAHFPFGLAFALAVGGCLLAELIGDVDRLRTCSEELATVARREGFALYAAAAVIHGATAELVSGDQTGSVAEMRRGLRQWAALGTDAFVTWIHTWIAESLVARGELDEARDVLAEVDRRLAVGQERIAELRRFYVGGKLRLAEGDVEGAAVAFGDVIELARAARARGPELEAEAALAAL